MGNLFLGISLLVIWFLPFLGGCVSTPVNNRQEIVYEDGKVQKFSYLGDTHPGNGSRGFLDAVETLNKIDPGFAPNLADLPGGKDSVRKYTGLIENLTNYDISIPSDNSGAMLIVPAHRWMEYITWSPKVHLYGFVDGKQVYYQSLCARPGKYKYMGNCYDFVAKIEAPPEPVKEVKPYCPPKHKPKRKKRKKVICPPPPKCPPPPVCPPAKGEVTG